MAQATTMRRWPIRSPRGPVSRAPRDEPAVNTVMKRPDSARLAPSLRSCRGAVGNSWKAAKKVMKVIADTSTKCRVSRRSGALDTPWLVPGGLLGQGVLFILGQAPDPAPGAAVEDIDQAQPVQQAGHHDVGGAVFLGEVAHRFGALAAEAPGEHRVDRPHAGRGGRAERGHPLERGELGHEHAALD